MNFIHFGIVTEKDRQAGFLDCLTWTLQIVLGVSLFCQKYSVWEPSLKVCGASGPARCLPWAPSPGQPRERSLPGGRGAAVIAQVSEKQGKSKHSPETGLYCVVTSFTIMLMIRDPRGHVHRSMLGFFILSWRSWSSSQRSSFTNSAT